MRRSVLVNRMLLILFAFVVGLEALFDVSEHQSRKLLVLEVFWRRSLGLLFNQGILRHIARIFRCLRLDSRGVVVGALTQLARSDVHSCEVERDLRQVHWFIILEQVFGIRLHMLLFVEKAVRLVINHARNRGVILNRFGWIYWLRLLQLFDFFLNSRLFPFIFKCFVLPCLSVSLHIFIVFFGQAGLNCNDFSFVVTFLDFRRRDDNHFLFLPIQDVTVVFGSTTATAWDAPGK